MGLKKSIVIVNEYTTKTASGGTRGGTPGDYISRYMSRDEATEDLSPAKVLAARPYPATGRDQADFIEKYMARESAVDAAQDVEGLRRAARRTPPKGGVAFGYGSPSLTAKQLRAASRDMQALFDSGKTVMKTVISFDEKYLRDNGIIKPDFEFKRRGDYRGNIDQMKLRRAIMKGCEKLARQYSDLRYVGVIQVDTAHVHCHLAMADAGKGNLAADGTQKGKISRAGKAALRRGIDMALDMQRPLAQLASNAQYGRRHAVCYVKKRAHEAMAVNGTAQFLLSCLPADRKYWRAGSNAKAMRKPNAIMRGYVEELLAQPGSGYDEALESLDRYCKRRRKREGMGRKQYEDLRGKARERIVKECMDGAYAVLRSIPKEELTVRSATLDAMSKDYAQAAKDACDGGIARFGFRLRSYEARKKHHAKEKRKFEAALEDYDRTPEPDPSSRALRDYFAFEAQYNAMLLCKYQHFLDFLPPRKRYEDRIRQLEARKRSESRLEAMLRDGTMRGRSARDAEAYGMAVYGIPGGGTLSTGDDIIKYRLELVRERHARERRELERDMVEDGLALKATETGYEASREKPYGFDAVKALDIHHLKYDFMGDVRVSDWNRDSFVKCADRRAELYAAAAEYLRLSGQGDVIESLPGADVRAMAATADAMRRAPVLPSELKEIIKESRARSRTVRLDKALDRDLKIAVRETAGREAEALDREAELE